MSRLAPGRKVDVQRLIDRRNGYTKHSPKWNLNQSKIEDLVEEGKCLTIHSMRQRLLNAAIADDNDEIIKISNQIDEHIKYHHRQRFERSWLDKKG